MNYENYKKLFDEILDSPSPAPPYDDEMYLNYVRLNKARMKRWDRQIVLDEYMTMQLKQITHPQHWIIITEPWCGDAAHILPLLVQMTEQNELLTYDIQLRDSAPFLIEKYLSNGSKSIPKLIVRDEADNDIFVWGSRPVAAQKVADELKANKASKPEILDALQRWYNEDKGNSLFEELSVMLRQAELT